MKSHRVDYDRIASTYNLRFEHDRRTDTLEALAALADELQARKVLEVGCGTGRWIGELPVDSAIGLDRSMGMLRQARGRTVNLQLIQAQAEALPLDDGRFDLVYCVNAVHHFDRPQCFVQEAARTLRPGGALGVIGMNPHDRYDDWYVYHYFEGSYHTDLERFPTWSKLGDWMHDFGLNRVELRSIQRIQDHKQGRAVLDDPFLRKDSTSQLVLLSQQAYDRGLQRIREALEEAERCGQTLEFPVNICIEMLVGWKQ